jgi:hypothetical protein
VASQQGHHDHGEEREHDRLDDHEGREDARAHRHPALWEQVVWSTAAEQLQSRQSIRHGITHVTSRHWIAVIAPMCVLQFPYRNTTQQVLKFPHLLSPQWHPPGHACPGSIEQSR